MSPRTRSILAWVLFALGTLVILVGSLTLWVKRQALDTDAWVDTSSQLLEDDEVRMALSVYIVDQLYASADPQAVLEERLPTNLQGLAGPIAGALRQPAVEGVDRFLQRPRVQDLWEDVNRVAHQELIAVLEDDTRGNITTGSGVVTLNLRTLVVNIGTELGFGDELDARLPQDVGQIEILQSDELEAAQTGVKLIKWMSWLVILIAFACYAGAVWLARGRRAMLRNVGAALFIVGILLLVIRRVVGNYIVDALSSGESVRDAIGHSWLIGTNLLAEVAWALIIYGIVILIGTLLAGPMRYATRARGAIAPNLRDRPEIGWGILAVLYLLLVLWGPVPALRNWLGILLLGALVALGFEAFRRVAIGELGPGDTAPPSSASRSTPGARCLSFTSSGMATARPSSSCTAASRAAPPRGGSSYRLRAAGRSSSSSGPVSAPARPPACGSTSPSTRRSSRRSSATARTWSASPTAAWSRCWPRRSGRRRSARSP